MTQPERIAFTANATEALNAAVDALIGSNDHAITTVCEHNSVLRPLYRRQDAGAQLTILSSDALGRIDPADLEAAFRPNTRCVVMGHASNLTGNVTDLQQISEITHRHDALLIVDAAQTAGCLPIDAEASGIDVLCFTGHKGLMGPQGTGGLYARPGLEIRPFKAGGSGFNSFDRAHPSEMPAALEAGSPNVHGIAGLNAALDFILSVGVEAIHAKEAALAARFLKGVRDLPGIRLLGDPDAPLRAPIVSLNVGLSDSARIGDRLWTEYEICTRAGTHCAPLMHTALGTRKQGAVRFSFSYFNTEAKVDCAVRAVAEIAQEEACE